MSRFEGNPLKEADLPDPEDDLPDPEDDLPDPEADLPDPEADLPDLEDDLLDPDHELGVNLHELLEAFVKCHGGMKQRDASWYAAMGTTIGGSELAAIMGTNPYSGFMDVVRGKLITMSGGNAWTGGSEACWWGTLFEDVIGEFVSADLGSAVVGDQICIQEFEGHRNSPDGYIVARFYLGGNGKLQLWTTSQDPTKVTESRILLLEFKCPMTRKPTGKVPIHYRPQVWSGLAVSSVASMGLFVDAVYRKCGILDIGETEGYDTAYHHRDRGRDGMQKPPWTTPESWGIISVYAPRLDAPIHIRMGWKGTTWETGDPDDCAAQAAWQIHSEYFGLLMKNHSETYDVADLGDMDARIFNQTLGLIDRKRFQVRRSLSCFADGRGANLHSTYEVGRHIDARQKAAPEHYWLMGVLPWKLMSVDYSIVQRRPGFLEEVAPLINEVHKTVKTAFESKSPDDYLNSLPQHSNSNRRGEEFRPPAVSDVEIQALFDSLISAP